MARRSPRNQVSTLPRTIAVLLPAKRAASDGVGSPRPGANVSFHIRSEMG